MIRITPVRFASAFGGALFGTIGPISPWNRRVIFNIGYAMPETDSGQRRRIARQAWHNMGRVVGEFFHIEALMKSGYVSLEGGEHLDPERGGMLIGAHLGCWELIGGPALMQGYAASCVYRPTNNPLVNALLHKRNRVYTRVYEKGRDGARGITETIRRKEFFSMLVDQKLREGIMLDFFGHKASTAVAHVKAALRMDVPILMVQMVLAAATRNSSSGRSTSRLMAVAARQICLKMLQKLPHGSTRSSKAGSVKTRASAYITVAGQPPRVRLKKPRTDRPDRCHQPGAALWPCRF